MPTTTDWTRIGRYLESLTVDQLRELAHGHQEAVTAALDVITPPPLLVPDADGPLL